MKHLSSFERSELIAAYILNDLTPAETAWVEANIAVDIEWQKELNSLQDTWDLIPLGLPEDVQPSPKLGERLMAEVLAIESPVTVTRSVPKLPRSSIFPILLPDSSWRWAVVVAIAAITGGWMWDSWHSQKTIFAIRQELQATKDRSQQERNRLTKEVARLEKEMFSSQVAMQILQTPNSRLMTVKDMNGGSAGGSLIIVGDLGKAFLSLRQVPHLPTDRTYRMWAYVDGKKVACADFSPDIKGEVRLPLPFDRWQKTTAIVVTIEPRESLNNPTGSMVFGSGEI
jgi:hypothetical protein